MAYRVAVATGNWTTAATWYVADATSLSDSQSAAQALTTTFVSSAAFSPGAITVDGLGFKVAFRATTPTANVEVRLAQAGALVAGTLVTAAVSDIVALGGYNTGAAYDRCPFGWYYFKFAAPVTLLAATAYTLQARIASGTNQLSFYRDGTIGNYARMLITTTTGAPAAGDCLFVIRHLTGVGAGASYTVTVDETASTDYGSGSLIFPSIGVGNGCALEFPTTGNNKLRISGWLELWGTGRLTMGSAATPMPTTATATIEFDCGANGDFGILNFPESTLELNGSPRTSGKAVVQGLLNADAAAAATTLNVDTDTGWLSGDSVIIGATTRTNTQTETRVLNGDAGASSMAITVGLTNAHSGTAPLQGEVALATRNVVIKAVGAFSWIWRDGSDATLIYRWAAFDTPGSNLEIGNIRVASEVTRSRTFEFCAFLNQTHSFEGPNVEGGTLTFNDCIFRTAANLGSGPSGMVYSGRVNLAANRGVLFYLGTVQQHGLSIIGEGGVVVRDTRFCGSGIYGPNASYGFGFYGWMDVEGCEFHSSPANCAPIEGGAPDSLTLLRVVDCHFWRNAHYPLSMAGYGRAEVTIERCQFRGNTPAHGIIGAQAGAEPWVRFVDCDFESDASFTTATGIFFGTSFVGVTEFQDCRFSQVVAHTSNDIGRTGTVGNMRLPGVIILNNVLLGAATPVSAAVTNDPVGRGRFSYMNEDGIVDAHRTLTQFGLIENQIAVYHTAQPCEQLTPNAAAVVGLRPLRSSSVFKPVPAGESVTFSVWIKRQSTHNGVAPKIVVWANGQGGWTDTRETYGGGLDVWTELTITVGPAVSDSVAEACVEVDGTVGAVYIDDWSATTA